MTLREIILSVDFDLWVRKISFELFGENPEYIRSLFFPVYKKFFNLSHKTEKKNTDKELHIGDDGIIYAGDVPAVNAQPEDLLDMECTRDVFNFLLWELAQSGRKWS